jgi:hypothetical protein
LTYKPSKVLIIGNLNCHSGGSETTEEYQGGVGLFPALRCFASLQHDKGIKEHKS